MTAALFTPELLSYPNVILPLIFICRHREKYISYTSPETGSIIPKKNIVDVIRTFQGQHSSQANPRVNLIRGR